MSDKWNTYRTLAQEGIQSQCEVGINPSVLLELLDERDKLQKARYGELALMERQQRAIEVLRLALTNLCDYVGPETFNVRNNWFYDGHTALEQTERILKGEE